MTNSKKDQDIVTRARERYRQTTTDWHDNQSDMAEDLEFLHGKQPNNFFGRNQQAYNENNPQVTVDLLNTPISHIENTLRSQDFSMQIHRSTGEIDEDFIQVLQGKIRAIEVDSDDKQQTIKAAGKNGALVYGIGFLKVCTEYVDDDSFDQKIKFRGFSDNAKIIPNYAVEDNITFSDADEWFEYEIYTEDQYQDLYGDSELASTAIPAPYKERSALYEEGNYTVLKYWFKETKDKETLYEWMDGSVTTGTKDRPIALLPQVDDNEQPVLDENNQPVLAEVPIPLKRKRTVKETKVKWVVTNGYEVLDKGDWHNDTFPFVGFVGNFAVLDGKKMWYGAIRHTKGSQLMYNFYASQNAKRLATSGVAPWIATAKQVGNETVRQLFENSHYQPTPLLVYDVHVEGATTLPEPHRVDMAQPDIASTQTSMQSTRMDIMSTLGQFDAGLSNTNMANGNQVNPSGIALNTLAQQGQLNNLHFTANFTSSYKRLCDVVLGLFPYVYDTPREETIIAQDGTHKAIWLNKPFIDEETGENKLFDFDNLKVSQLSVTVDTGPSFANWQSQIVDQLTKMAEVTPNGMLAFGDIIARNMDFPGHDLVAERIQAMAEAQMPFLTQLKNAALKNAAMNNLPPQAKTIIMKLQQQLQVANQHVQTLAGEVQKFQFDEKAHTTDNAAKLKLALINAQVEMERQKAELTREMASAKDDKALELMHARMEQVNQSRTLYVDMIKHVDKMGLEHRKIDEQKKAPPSTPKTNSTKK